MNRTNQENENSATFRQVYLNQLIEDHSSELLLAHIEDLESEGSGHKGIPARKDTEVQVVMLTVLKNNDQIVKATGNVVNGHFVKEGPAWQIHYGVQMLYNNDSAINPQLAWKVYDFIQQEKTTVPDYNLSGREKEILGHLVDGGSYKEIASQLFISLETVRTHIRHIYDKMQVRSKSQAVCKALKERLSFL
jgi:DNA-binding NarL/FixJ family response regulator